MKADLLYIKTPKCPQQYLLCNVVAIKLELLGSKIPILAAAGSACTMEQ